MAQQHGICHHELTMVVSTGTVRDVPERPEAMVRGNYRCSPVDQSYTLKHYKDRSGPSLTIFCMASKITEL